MSVDDDQTTVLVGRTRRPSVPDLREDGLTGAGRLVLEGHAFNIQCTGPSVKMTDRGLQSQRTDGFVDAQNTV